MPVSIGSPGAPAPGLRHSSLAFAALSLFSSSLAAPWPRSWGPFVLVDAILTPTREPSLLSSQVQQRPGHPPLGKPISYAHRGDVLREYQEPANVRRYGPRTIYNQASIADARKAP